MALPDAVAIRRGGPDDAEALAHLHLDVWDDAYTGLMPQGILDGRRAKVTERVERWVDILGQERPTWLAEDADGLIGFSGAGPARDNDVDIDRTTTTEIKDIGSTKVTVPEEAKKKLSS